MIWNSFEDFVRMGGHGLYVWGSYAVVAAVMVLEALLAHRRQRRALAEARDGEGQP